MSDRRAALSGTIVGGGFRGDVVLGKGGMGAVYAAEQLSTGKKRALKVMHPLLVADGRALDRFLAEAKVGSASATAVACGRALRTAVASAGLARSAERVRMSPPSSLRPPQ